MKNASVSGAADLDQQDELERELPWEHPKKKI